MGLISVQRTLFICFRFSLVFSRCVYIPAAKQVSLLQFLIPQDKIWDNLNGLITDVSYSGLIQGAI